MNRVPTEFPIGGWTTFFGDHPYIKIHGRGQPDEAATTKV